MVGWLAKKGEKIRTGWIAEYSWRGAKSGN